ncbi:MAG: inositol-3-phosphate synthase, partial [Planctomycetota bacterium JB042]
MTERTGVWLVGALGGLATTVVVGARAIARGLDPGGGVATLGPAFSSLDLAPLDGLVFGGHDVRTESLVDSAAQIGRENGSLRPEVLGVVREDLEAIDARRRPGISLNGGAAIDALVEDGGAIPAANVSDLVGRVRADLAAFKEAERLDRLIVVNLASTEPPAGARPELESLDAFEAAVAADTRDAFRAGQLYAYAAMLEGAAYLNFTPSDAIVPALEELAAREGLPFMGSDGKTGETLVKSALAPMFRDRALRVLTWQGYNILGDR